jgi:hypothetical protein
MLRWLRNVWRCALEPLPKAGWGASETPLVAGMIIYSRLIIAALTLAVAAALYIAIRLTN